MANCGVQSEQATNDVANKCMWDVFICF